MEIEAPQSKFAEVAGSFELNRPNIERIVRAMERHVPATAKTWNDKDKARKLEFELEFKDGRKAKTSDIEDLEHFSFDHKGRETFRIRLEGVDPKITCEFSYPFYKTKARVHVFRAADVEAAGRDVEDAIISARTWYSVLFEHSISAWSNVPLFIVWSLATLDEVIFGRDVLPIWAILFVIGPECIALMAKTWLFDRLVIPFGAEAQRVDLKQRIRRGIPLAAGALVIAIIGGGYFLHQ